MTRLKAVLVDDERLARSELRRLLEAHKDVEIVAEAANGDDARSEVSRHRPDLLFLDISMPGESGFELLDSLDPPLPAVIFVTAFDEHAIQAFRVNALDYLLKPVDPQLLAEAIERAQRQAGGAATPALAAALDGQQAPLRPGDSVFVRDGDQCLFVRLDTIRLLEADGNYTRVVLQGKNFLLHRSLSSLEQRLPQDLFFRANRSQIINLHCIRQIAPCSAAA
jgi:two-component system LytT family response regulator